MSLLLNKGFNTRMADQEGSIVQRIQSNEYFDAIQVYFVDHKDPARVYAFLLNTLWTDKYNLSERMFYQRVDTLETTEDCVRFYIGTECILVLCSQSKKQSSN
jgi:hypothetical protein